MSAVRKHESFNQSVNEKRERKAMKEEQHMLAKLQQGRTKSTIKRHQRMFTDDDVSVGFDI
jgi:hypothetical protein